MNQTKVVNVKVAYIRPQYQNLEAWMQDSQNIYIGRGRIVFIDKKRFPEKDSIWANPYKVKKNELSKVINDYEIYIRSKLEKDPKLVKELLKLRGKNLGCWCKPSDCHGDVLVKLIQEYSKEKSKD